MRRPDSGVAWAADSSSSDSLCSRSDLSKSTLASSTAVGAGGVNKLTQAADSGVAWAARPTAGRSGSLSSRSRLS